MAWLAVGVQDLVGLAINNHGAIQGTVFSFFSLSRVWCDRWNNRERERESVPVPITNDLPSKVIRSLTIHLLLVAIHSFIQTFIISSLFLAFKLPHSFSRQNARHIGSQPTSILLPAGHVGVSCGGSLLVYSNCRWDEILRLLKVQVLLQPHKSQDHNKMGEWLFNIPRGHITLRFGSCLHIYVQFILWRFKMFKRYTQLSPMLVHYFPLYVVQKIISHALNRIIVTFN